MQRGLFCLFVLKSTSCNSNCKTAWLEILQIACLRFQTLTIKYIGNIKTAQPRSQLHNTNFPDWQNNCKSLTNSCFCTSCVQLYKYIAIEGCRIDSHYDHAYTLAFAVLKKTQLRVALQHYWRLLSKITRGFCLPMCKDTSMPLKVFVGIAGSR